MHTTHILYRLAVLSFCCVTLSSTLSCYVCQDQNCVNSTVTQTCTAALAEASKTYLSQHYVVNASEMSVTSSQFECLQNFLLVGFGSSNQEYQYRGCIYNNMQGCGYPTRVIFNVFSRCSVCNKNDCNRNPASRLSVSALTVLGTVVMAMIARLVPSC